MSYIVRHVVKVDRPELRDASFASRAPSSTASRVQVEDRKKADAIARDLLSGEYDFASEFVSSVEVWQTLRGGKTRQVLPVVHRERAESGKIVVIAGGV